MSQSLKIRTYQFHQNDCEDNGLELLDDKKRQRESPANEAHTKVMDLDNLIKTHKADLVFLFETLVHSNKIEEVGINIGFEGAFSMD